MQLNVLNDLAEAMKALDGKKTSDEDEVIACINSGIGMASTKKRENTETQKSHCHTVV